MRRSAVSVALPVIAVLSVVSSCSSDSPAGSGTSVGTSASTEASATAPPTSGAQGDLTATAPGVTADSIKLGLAGLDPDTVRSFGVPFNGPGSQQLYQAWIKAQNDRGGVLGRNIELAFTPYLPIGDAQAEAACVALTEDEHVFAATGILLGDTSLCITETHKTPYIGIFGQSAERDARALAPFLAIEMADDRQRSAGVQQFIDQGLLKGVKVGLYTEAQDVAVTEGVIVPMLKDAGVDVVESITIDDYGDDTVAQDQALDTAVAKLHAADVDVVLNVSNFAPLMVAFQRNGWFPPQVLATSAQAISADFVAGSGIEPGSLENVLVAAPYIPTKAELLADPLVATCIDEYNASGQDPAVVPDTTDAATLNGIANQCAAFRLFVLAATGAGPNLTPDTFGAAADALGVLHLPGVPYGSLGPDKHSVGDAIGVYDFDAAANQMVPTGPAIHVG
jgi:hypothetical protein